MKNSIHLSAALHINIMLGQRWGEHGSRLGVGGGGVNKSIFTVFKIWCFTSILLCLFYVFVRRCSTDPVYPMWSLKLYQSCLRLVETGRRLTGPDLSSWDITSPHGPCFAIKRILNARRSFMRGLHSQLIKHALLLQHRAKILPRVGDVWSPKTFLSMIYSRRTPFVFLSHLICLLDSYSSDYVAEGKNVPHLSSII